MLELFRWRPSGENGSSALVTDHCDESIWNARQAMVKVGADVREMRRKECHIGWRRPHKAATIIVEQAAGYGGLATDIATVKGEYSSAWFQDLHGQSDNFVRLSVSQMMQYPIEHHDVGRLVLCDGSRIKKTFDKPAAHAKTTYRVGNVGSARIVTNVVGTFGKVLDYEAWAASDVDDAFAAFQWQVGGNSLDTGSKEAPGLLEGLV
jgi:hypothetical protein